MKKKEAIIKKFEKGIENSKSGEIIRNVFSSLLCLSIVGSPIATLINSFIPSRRFLRLESFVKELAKEYEKIEERIDLEYLSSDEYAFLFEHCIMSASENYQQAKLDAFKAILVNSVISGHEIQEQKEFYLNLTNQLTTIHLKILRFCYNTEEYVEINGLTRQEITGNIESSLKIIFNDYDFGTIKMTINDLYKFGLIDMDTSKLRTMTVSQGLDIIGNQRTTESGNKYIDFITI